MSKYSDSPEKRKKREVRIVNGIFYTCLIIAAVLMLRLVYLYLALAFKWE